MQFKFHDGGFSGYMAFTGPVTSRLLLVTDAGHDAVHVIDVAGRLHVGYVAAPGIIAGPRGVAARGSLVAISTWRGWLGDHVVRLFEGSGTSWTAVRVLGGGFGDPGREHGQLNEPTGVRFTADGNVLVVVDGANHRVSLFRVEDGSFVRQVATEVSYPMDVEECEGGWLVACYGTHTVEFVGDVVGDSDDDARPILGENGDGDGEFRAPSALALVPGLGLVVRELGNGGRVQFFATPDTIAMASMSVPRVAWMVGVARGTAHRALAGTQASPQPRVTKKRQRPL
jgi:hypothetical protein